MDFRSGRGFARPSPQADGWRLVQNPHMEHRQENTQSLSKYKSLSPEGEKEVAQDLSCARGAKACPVRAPVGATELFAYVSEAGSLLIHTLMHSSLDKQRLQQLIYEAPVHVSRHEKIRTG